MTQLWTGIGNRARRAKGPLVCAIARHIAAFALAFQLALPLAAPALADDTGNFKTVAGISVYVGLIPAEIVKGHPSGHPEAQMHGGPPNGPHAYHLIVALFDEESADRIEDAKVAAMVSGLGHVGQTNVALEPMLIDGTITYGAFIDLGALERFDIALTIIAPDRPEPVRVDFENQHLP